jgi:hypothetical protein
LPTESAAIRGDSDSRPGERETFSLPLSQPAAARRIINMQAGLRKVLDLFIITLSIRGLPPISGDLGASDRGLSSALNRQTATEFSVHFFDRRVLKRISHEPRGCQVAPVPGTRAEWIGSRFA